MNNEVRLDSRQELEHQKIYAMLGLSGKALNRRMTTHQIRSVNKKIVTPFIIRIYVF